MTTYTKTAELAAGPKSVSGNTSTIGVHPELMVSQAINYIQRGWSVIPLHSLLPGGGCTCKQPGCSAPGKHPVGRWQLYQRQRATPEKIYAWFQSGQPRNIGIVTGPISGLLVVDLDGKEGKTTIEMLAAAGYRLPDGGPRVQTGSGGEHIYLKWPDKQALSGTVRLLPGLDLRGNGNQVVAPPSLHASGRRYEWITSPEAPLQECPDWLLQMSNYLREAGIPGKLQALRQIVEGSRNDTLASLAGAMRRVGMEKDMLSAVLAVINATLCDPPLADREVESIGRSIGRYEPALRPQLHEVLSEDKYHLTDLGNAERLVARHGRDLRYCWPFGRWYVWDGTRWTPDDTAEVERRAKETVRSIYTDAAQALNEDRRKNLAKHAMQSEAKERVTAMVALARSEPGIPVLPEQLDADPLLLNCRNGTIDLRTGTLLPHKREDLLTKVIPIDYDPDAKAPRWYQFLNEIMAENQDLIDFLQRAIGYTLTAYATEQVLFICYGPGANGKSVFLDTLLTLLGPYGKPTDPDLLMSRKSDAHPTSIADLMGVRLAVTIETQEGRRLNETLVKWLTGGDKLKARFMRQDFFEFQPTHKLWLATNHKPVIRGTDIAIWRRIRLIPFNVTIPEEKRDPMLTQKLTGELPGILAWAVRGCLAWQQEGLGQPEAVKKATADYRREMDVLQDFLDERCVVKPNAHATAKELYEAYCQWCEETGERAVTQREFGIRLTERGFIRDRGAHGVRIWSNIGLLETNR